jgi:mevalonate kinase
MPAISATAPGKIILFGEHTVVYGRPAIAAPVPEVAARAVALANPLAPLGEVRIQAPDIDLEANLADLPVDHPLALAVHNTLSALGIQRPPAFTIRVTSTIPLAAGMGSGAATSIAIIRAVAGFMGINLSDEQVSALAFEVEKVYHGTPSGIDNTVITYRQPIIFRRDQPVEFLRVGAPIMIVIGDTGVKSPTAVAVGDLRQAWKSEPGRYEALFDQVAVIVDSARRLIEGGEPRSLGPLLDLNQRLLQELGVSSPELDHLVETARRTGALGAKLSGGGRGGNMIALVDSESVDRVIASLKDAGALRALVTTIAPISHR